MLIFKKNHFASIVLSICMGIGIVLQSHAFMSHNRFDMAKITQQQEHQQEIIVLIHGLMRTSMSMAFLKRFLEHEGYQVYSYGYPSAKYSIQEHGVYLNQYIIELIKKNPDVKIHLITHSLGGIISREALAKLSAKQLKNIGYLIMMAPPNQGSYLAKLSTKIFPLVTSPIKPLTELSSDDESYVHYVPVPNVKMGIIAGRFDAKVPPTSAILNNKTDLVVINTTHTFIMNNFKTRQYILNFLEKGAFGEG